MGNKGWAAASLVAAIWLAAGVATGQSKGAAQPLPDFPVRSLSDATADKAEADRLIDGSGHPDLFENVSSVRGPAVRHKASGLICRFWAGAGVNGVRVYEAKAGVEDVSCQTDIEGVSVTHYASQYTPAPTAESEVHAAVAAIRQRWADLRAYEGEAASTTADEADLPKRYVSRGVVTLAGGEYMTKVIVAQAGVWTVKQRMTVKLDGALRGDLWSETLMVQTLIEVVHGERAESPLP